jgi:formate-dependent nitrite reductase membrane component NrfD
VNAFEVLGPILVVWALLVSFLGITRENFPDSQTAERLVGAISVLLVVLAIGAAIYTSTHEDKKGEAALPSLPA